MQRKDYYLLVILFLVVLLIYYPLFFNDYLYTDEAEQLWMYKPGSGFNMFISQGRWITEILFAWLFGAIDTVHQIVYIRLFSLLGWLVCLPVWYIVIKRVVAKEPAWQYLPFLTCLYLVTSLPFTISIQWASCLELFLANTAGLISGAVLLKGIHFINNRFRITPLLFIGALAAGVVSLFTYQSGFGCFLIPFLLHFLVHGNGKKYQTIIAGVVFYFFVYAVYFVLYKLSLNINNIPHNPRTDVHINLVDKLLFFFARPFKRSFWFNVIADEHNNLARALYVLLVAGWMGLTLVRTKKFLPAAMHIATVMFVFIISFLPSLIVRENYASNRTMLALNICVWLVCIEMIVFFIKNKRALPIAGITAAIVMLILGGYNFRYQFLQPVTKEYAALKNFVQQQYHPGIHTFYFIPASREEFKNRFNRTMSMDEFGVPSTSFDWVPQPMSKQLVYEITGNRKTADQLVVKTWPDLQSFINSGEKVTNGTLLVNVPQLITATKP